MYLSCWLDFVFRLLSVGSPYLVRHTDDVHKIDNFTAIFHPLCTQVIMHLVLMLCCFAVITTLYVRTLAVYVRRYGFKRTGQQWRPEQEPQQQPEKRQKQRQHAALWRLVLLLTCFEVVWLLVIINDFRTMHSGGGRESGMGDAPSTFMVSKMKGRDSAARRGRLSFSS